MHLGRISGAGHALSAPSHTAPRLHGSFLDVLSQTVPIGALRSAGHVTAFPSHVSAGSHGPVLLRHIVPDVAMMSAGHGARKTPVHSSSGSHGPVDGRQTVPLACSTHDFASTCAVRMTRTSDTASKRRPIIFEVFVSVTFTRNLSQNLVG